METSEQSRQEKLQHMNTLFKSAKNTNEIVKNRRRHDNSEQRPERQHQMDKKHQANHWQTLETESCTCRRYAFPNSTQCNQHPTTHHLFKHNLNLHLNYNTSTAIKPRLTTSLYKQLLTVVSGKGFTLALVESKVGSAAEDVSDAAQGASDSVADAELTDSSETNVPLELVFLPLHLCFDTVSSQCPA